MSITQEDLVLLRTYFAQISKNNISIPEPISEKMQSSFVSHRKDRGEGIDGTWFGNRIVVAKGFARIHGREMVTEDDWQRSLDICLKWEERRK
jgi:hypothetical protein